MSEIGRHSARDKVRYKRSQTTAARRKRSLIVLSAVGAALLVGIAVVIVVLATGGSTKYTRVPEIEGLTYNKAKAELKKANLDIRVDPTQDVANVKIDKKKVGYQHPVKGANAEKGSVVTVALLEVPSKGEDAQSKASTAPASTPAAQPEATPAPAPEPAPAPAPAAAPAPDSGLSARWKATRSTPHSGRLHRLWTLGVGLHGLPVLRRPAQQRPQARGSRYLSSRRPGRARPRCKRRDRHQDRGVLHQGGRRSHLRSSDQPR